MSQSILEIPLQGVDELPTAGREPAICELTCTNCGDGLRFDDQQCSTCGERNLRYRA